MKQEIRKKDIAIIGMSGKFPKSKNLKEFWSNLTGGEELITFYNDTELREAGVSEDYIQNPNYVKADSALENVESFDYNFFGYTKAEAAAMDPQIRALHEQVWLALEDAGCNPYQYKEKIGVFLTASDNINWRAYSLLSKNEMVNPFFLNQISDKNFASTLISYNLNLRGPSYFTDTACSSSLVCTHVAARSLLLRECSIAIAGGARIESTDTKGYMHQEGMINSKDGHCRAFDKDSSGTITGEGVGIVILKRMEDAVRDKDHIYAVIRSTAVNNDGDRKVGYTAPSIAGQAECIRLAHQIANIEPEAVTYIETHGTGTKLGDPIEIEALNKAFNYNTNHKCAIGSVKASMGHLDTTAGISGLIKTALVLKNKKIPASLHFKEANPEINFKSGPFYVNQKLSDWIIDNQNNRIAGVSSFGIGGTNAHAVLEEFVSDVQTEEDQNFHLIRFSAKSVKSLEQYQIELKNRLEEKDDLKISDLAYTLQIGRKQFGYNRFLVAKTKEEIITALTKNVHDSLFTGKLKPNKKTVFMCSGSGVQYIDMCKGLYNRIPYFKQLIGTGFQQLKEITGIDFSKIVYPDTITEDFLHTINQNEYTQPLVFIFEYAVAKLLIKWGVSPDYMIGHSTGEYVAACLSGVFSYEQGLPLVVKRAKIMSLSPEGTMLSIELSELELQQYLTKEIAIAAINSPNSCVVSGTVKAINELQADLIEKGIPNSRLRISLGAHSFLMDTVLDDYAEALKTVDFSEPKIPFISNLTGRFITAEEACSVKYWIDHLRHTVRFSDGITHLLKEPDTVFIEVGPSNALTTMFQQHQKLNTHGNIAVNVIRHPKNEIDDQKFLLSKLGELWLNGIDINWEEYHENNKVNKASLPGYVFEKTKLPARVNLFEKLQQQNDPLAFTFENDFFENDEKDEEEIADKKGEMSLNYVAPSNEIEYGLVKIWEDFFGIQKIGIADDFFSIGGNSLKALTMVKLVAKAFDIEITIKDFYTKTTIKDLAHEISLVLKIMKMTKEKDKEVNKENIIKI